jgi:hypothetical protein
MCSNPQSLTAGTKWKFLLRASLTFDVGGNMGFLRTTGQRFGIAGELFAFFWSNKRWWMTPILITLALFAVLLILAQSSAIAPFIYSFF